MEWWKAALVAWAVVTLTMSYYRVIRIRRDVSEIREKLEAISLSQRQWPR